MLATIDRIVADFAQDYRRDIVAAEGALFRALESPTIGSTLDSNLLSREVLYDTQALTSASILSLINSSVRRTTPSRSTWPTDLKQGVEIVIAEAVDKIVRQKNFDLRAIVENYRVVVIRASMFARVKGWSREYAFQRAKEQNKLPATQRTMDRSGRRWGSEKYIVTVLRHALLTIYNEVTIFDLVERGETTGRVVHENEDHSNHNLVFSFAPEEGMQSYDEIRDSVFHPNSRALVDSK